MERRENKMNDCKVCGEWLIKYSNYDNHETGKEVKVDEAKLTDVEIEQYKTCLYEHDYIKEKGYSEHAVEAILTKRLALQRKDDIELLQTIADEIEHNGKNYNNCWKNEGYKESKFIVINKLKQLRGNKK
jgi:hypothetical protein